MSLAGIMLVLVCAFTSACSSFLLRSSIEAIGGFTFEVSSFVKLGLNPVFLLGVILYGIAGIFWFRVLSTEELSIAYPVFISLVFFMVTSGAIMFFQEALTVMKVMGLLVIVSGIIIVTCSGN